jgi:hypothetical protein
VTKKVPAEPPPPPPLLPDDVAYLPPLPPPPPPPIAITLTIFAQLGFVQVVDPAVV